MLLVVADISTVFEWGEFPDVVFYLQSSDSIFFNIFNDYK